MAPGTRSSKDSQPAKASNNVVENNRSKTTSDDIKPITAAAEGKENTTTGQPLGPPPRPTQQNNDADYFGQVHNPNNPTYQSEPNPFEAQFGNPSTETPGKLLPSVAALTSPSSLLPNETPGWSSLRSGPLSPAMLAGPATGDYFDGYARSFPTPNESGLRTGLTPGGGGSMFPAPSPNSQAIFNTLQMGQPTPNTMEFMRTGLTANRAVNGGAPTSQPNEAITSQNLDLKLPATQSAPENYAQHDADAANGLFMLAQSNGARSGNQFAVPTSSSGAVQPLPIDSSLPQTRSQKNSLSTTAHAEDSSDSDDSEEATKPATRSRGKRQVSNKPTNNRRKANETPGKTQSNKRQKMNSLSSLDRLESSPPLEEDEPLNKDGKKMTDDEKRKNFLERNRVAALKCRQRKKQWLQNLQAKVDLYSQENDALTQAVASLRDQNHQLRQILSQHKDCPVSAQQGFSTQTFMNMVHQPDSYSFIQPPNNVSQPMSIMMAGPTATASSIPRS